MGERRLLAVVFTDIKGYSSMMGSDEATTLRVVREHQAIVRSTLAEYGGREIRTIGDAFLLTFDSALAAVTWAVALQERMLAVNAGRPAKEQVWLRIGVHVGDVVLEDGDLHGETVNLAARVEPVAPTGGVAFTEPVALQVRNKTGKYAIEPMGTVPLKNIASPPALFRLVIAPVGAPPPASPARVRLPYLVAAVASLVLVGAVLLGLALVSRAPPRWPVASTDPTAQARFVDAVTAYERGDRSDAARFARSGLAADDDAALLWLMVSLCSPDLTEAVTASSKARELALGHPEASLVQAATDPTAAAASWDALLTAAPHDEFTRLVALERMEGDVSENVEKRIAASRAFVEEWPDVALARIFLAGRLHMIGDTDGGLLVLDEGLRRCPECAALRAQKGQILMGSGRHEEGVVECRRALEEDASQHECRARLADRALQLGDEAEVKRNVEALLAPEVPTSARLHFLTFFPQMQYMFCAEDGIVEIEDRGVALTVQSDPTAAVSLLVGYVELEVMAHHPARARVLLERLRALATAPEVATDTRDDLATHLLRLELMIAFLEGDAANVRAIWDRMEKLPADRYTWTGKDELLGHLRWMPELVDGRPDAALATVSASPAGCTADAEVLAVARALDRPDVAEPVLAARRICPPQYIAVRSEAHVWIAERALAEGDHETAQENLTAARTNCRQRPTGALADRMAAVEAELATSVP